MDASTRIENFPGHDGLSLALEHFDASNERSNRNRLIYTHGFGQNRLSWGTTALRLAAAGWPGMALDGRGHGDSAWSVDGSYEMDHFVWDLTTLARAHTNEGVDCGKPILVGASMGGLLALLAQAEPQFAERPMQEPGQILDLTHGLVCCHFSCNILI